jgi:hypothetical protein
MKTYRVDVFGITDDTIAPQFFSVHRQDGRYGPWVLKYSANYGNGYSFDEVGKIVEWLDSLKWLVVNEIRLYAAS